MGYYDSTSTKNINWKSFKEYKDDFLIVAYTQTNKKQGCIGVMMLMMKMKKKLS